MFLIELGLRLCELATKRQRFKTSLLRKNTKIVVFSAAKWSVPTLFSGQQCLALKPISDCRNNLHFQKYNPACHAFLMSSIPPVVHSSCPVSRLSCIPYVLHPSRHTFLMSCTPPVVHSSFPASLLSCILHVLHLSCHKFLMSCIPHVVYSAGPKSILSCIHHVMHPSCHAFLMSCCGNGNYKSC